MVPRLLNELLGCPEIVRVVITLNIPEHIELPYDERVVITANESPKGFAENHNTAFQQCGTPYFCSMNPDIQLQGDPFSPLLGALESMDASIAAPMVINSQGIVEDSVRSFPTLSSLLSKLFVGAQGRYPIEQHEECRCVHWAAGMFHLFRSADFRRLQGYDQDFFLYYEDVDICMRAWKAGMRVIACPTAVVIHDAQRTSRRSIRYLQWHLTSLIRYWMKHSGPLPRLSGCD